MNLGNISWFFNRLIRSIANPEQENRRHGSSGGDHSGPLLHAHHPQFLVLAEGRPARLQAQSQQGHARLAHDPR